MIRALVVDDEALAREGIRLELDRETDVSVVAEAVDGPAAVESISRFRPDIVFLDIQIPGFDGFEVLSRVPADRTPIIVFITAYDQHAVHAFDAQAIDYLLKPISTVRFHAALQRARDALRVRAMLERVDASVPESTSDSALRWHYYQRFTLRDRGRYVFVRATDVDWFESAANYVEIHHDGRTHLLRMTLSDLEKRLDPSVFVRIHRSTIVNLNRVQDIRPTQHGDFIVLLVRGGMVRLSRAYRGRVIGAKWPS